MSKAPKIDPQTIARILVEALPHMQRYDEEIVVVKYGGHAMGQEQAARDFARDVVLLEAAAALIVAGKAADLKSGAALGAASIDSGKAKRVLERMIAISNEAVPAQA